MPDYAAVFLGALLRGPKGAKSDSAKEAWRHAGYPADQREDHGMTTSNFFGIDGAHNESGYDLGF